MALNCGLASRRPRTMLTSTASIRLYVTVLLCSLGAAAETHDEEWLDPYDMLQYDAATKSMRKPVEPTNYDNVPTKRRVHDHDANEGVLIECKRKVAELEVEITNQKKRIENMSQQPTCNPVFKRFLIRLLREIKRVGLPRDTTDVFYDAKVRLSKQRVEIIETLIDGMESWKTGALDDAVSQILVDLKPHDYEAWKWHFEDTFGVEIDTALKVVLVVLIIIAIICTELWSVVSWFCQFKRLFAICFFISIMWNWLYLYKIAFAEHQNNIVKMDGAYEKCTGMKKMDWSDNLKEWFRSTWTLQDDICKRYYEAIMVNPILLVPPTKAISVTITTFITEPLKHIGQGISEFLRALLKDLPITLQIPVLITIVLAILVFMYGSVQAAFQYGIMAPLRRGHMEPPPPPAVGPPPPPAVGPPQLPPLREAHHQLLAGGDVPPACPPAGPGPDVRHRRPARGRQEPIRMFVETLHTADGAHSQNEPALQEEPAEARPRPSEPQRDMSPSTAERLKADTGPGSGGSASLPASNQRKQSSHTGGDSQVSEASSEARTSSISVETIGAPVQETAPVLLSDGMS